MYVDHNATAPMSDAVVAAVEDAMRTSWANPGSPHRAGQGSAVRVQFARRQVAEMVGCPAKEVFFTSGATEANAWVLHSSSMPVVASAVEHPSVLDWADETIDVDESGVISLAKLEERLQRGPALVSVMAANNETGVLQPVADVRALCAKYQAPYHCDATQIPGRMDFDVQADWVTISAHKMGGPRGIGALICAKPPPALLRGGSQERGHRAGTLNTPAIVGFGAAASAVRPVSADQRDVLEAFCRRYGANVLSGNAKRLPNTLSVLFDVPGDLIVTALDLRGIQASTGSACSSGAATNSHVLTAMGVKGTPVRFLLTETLLAFLAKPIFIQEMFIF